MKFLVLLATLYCSFVQSKPAGILKNKENESINNRPIVGVLAQDFTFSNTSVKFNKTYMLTSYVQYIESAGARVVPIRNDLTEAELKKLFSSLNGVLFPGGDVDLWTSGYARTANIIFDMAIKANDAGDIFPLWGTCLGFQMLHVMVAKGKDVLTWCHGENISLPLNYTKDYKKSRIFGQAPQDVTTYLGKLPITLNMHQNCVATETYVKEPLLQKFFKVLSTNEDKNGKVRFTSTVEAVDYPFFATQWHPETNQFRWLVENINHSKEAVLSMQYMANFFVNQARQSKHKFPSKKEEDAALIYNYEAVPCLPDKTDYEQCYFF